MWLMRTFEVIDDYTFSLTYPDTNIAEVGRLAEHYVTWFHKGYLSQFHPKYAGQDKVDAMAKEAGFASAAEFFKEKIDEGQGFPRANPDLPTMTPWVLKVGAPATTYVFERNPYYLAVDAIGQQLPYFDEVRQHATTDPTVLKLRALNGEYDYMLFLGLDIFPAAKTTEANEQTIRAVSWGGHAPGRRRAAHGVQPDHQRSRHARAGLEARLPLRRLARDQPRGDRHADLLRRGAVWPAGLLGAQPVLQRARGDRVRRLRPGHGQRPARQRRPERAR